MNAVDTLVRARCQVSDPVDMTEAVTVAAVLLGSLVPLVVDAVRHQDGFGFGRAALDGALRAVGVTARYSDITRAEHGAADIGLHVVARSGGAVLYWLPERLDSADRRLA